MAKTSSQSDFDRLIKIVEKVDIRVKEYLELAGYDKWSRIYAPVHRGWSMTLNIAESINAALVSARELPIDDFLEEVRLMFGRWNCENKKELFPSTEYVHNVNDKGRNYIVCLQKKMCTCGSFQYEEIPCEHVWAVLKFKSLRPDEFCSNLYTPTIVLKTYGFPIYPLPDKTEWVVRGYIMTDLVLPPEFKRPPGRPRKKARDKSAREMFESKGTNTCSICGIAGHNRRYCRNQPRKV
ncbi:uncharacterized protein [Solanum tuberosum]|uniref:uncharacterized protein n=1 Tax=Solanum tuberosum TaxID=4113 RepID=UPI00073A39D0|nr:PREDICTED: uncharacterized protein LOC107061743 [Solanum tuberosum]